jgi:hypothetical protein
MPQDARGRSGRPAGVLIIADALSRFSLKNNDLLNIMSGMSLALRKNVIVPRCPRHEPRRPARAPPSTPHNS